MAKLNTPRGPFSFKQVDLYLGTKRLNKEVAADNLKDVGRIMDKNDIHWGLFLGSVLGIVREGDFIDWDEDIDLFVLRPDEDKLRAALFDMVDEGFEVIRYLRYGLYSIRKGGEYIDFYIIDKACDGVLYKWTAGGGCFLEDDLVNTIRVNFKGGNYPIPGNPERFLTLRYGKDWRTPRQWASYEKSKFEVFKLKSIFWIKRHLPLWLFWVLVKHHTKGNNDAQAFIEKCKKLGYWDR